MKVYALESWHYAEGSTLIGVFSSLELAKEHAGPAEMGALYPGYWVSSDRGSTGGYQIQRMDLDSADGES